MFCTMHVLHIVAYDLFGVRFNQVALILLKTYRACTHDVIK